MDIKLISFSESKIVSMNVAHDIICEKIAENTGKEFKFEFCQTQNDLLASLKDGFENYNTVLLAVDVSRFVSTKAALFRALGFKCKLNEKITDLINSEACMATLNENQIKAHAAIPVGGKAFITNDGLFSAFGIESGTQKLIMVPIDERRIDTVIQNGMSSFMFKDMPKKTEEVSPKKEEVSDIPESMEGYVEPIEDFVHPEENAEPQYEEIYKDPVVPAVKENEEDYEDYNSSSYDEGAEYLAAKEAAAAEEDTAVFAEEFSTLASRGVNIAFARIGENDVLSSLLSRVSKSPVAQIVDFARVVSQDDDKRKENVATNARVAMRQTNSTFAVALSDVYQDENSKKYIFATLADVQKSSVFKIFASENENEDELYFSALESVLEKVDEASLNMNSMPLSENMINSQMPTSANKELSTATKIVIWVLIVVALCTLSALIIDTIMSNANMLAPTSEIISDVNDILLR